MGFLREGGNRNPPSLRQLFGDFLAAQKVTRPGAKPSPPRPQAKHPIHKNLLLSIMVNAMEYRLGVLGGMGPASSRASYPSFHPDG